MQFITGALVPYLIYKLRRLSIARHFLATAVNMQEKSISTDSILRAEIDATKPSYTVLIYSFYLNRTLKIDNINLFSMCPLFINVC
jgi:hypothetical protein